MTFTPGRSITHCGFCGAAYGASTTWPRDCPSCSETAWRNPLPVAVVLLPVDVDGMMRLLVARRTIEPCSGMPSLPGGYMEVGESWQEAAVRELREETTVVASPGDVTLFDVVTGNDTVQVFGLLPVRRIDDLPPSVPTPESEGWTVLDRADVDSLAFPTQRQVADAFFAPTAPTRY